MQTTLPTPALHRDTESRFFSWPTAMALCVLLYFLFTLGTYYDRVLFNQIIYNYLWPLFTAFAALSIVRTRLMRTVEGISLLLFCVWVGVSSLWVNGLLGIVTYSATNYHILQFCLVSFPLAFALSPRWRQPVIHAMLHVMIGVVVALCVVGIVTVLRQETISAPSGYMIGLSQRLDNRLYLLMYPNTGGTMLTIFAVLSVYLFLHCRHIAVKIYYALATIVLFVSLALTDSRTNMIALAFGLGCLGFLMVRKHLRASGLVKWIVGILCTIAITAGIYFAYEIPLSMVQSAASSLQNTGSIQMITSANAEEAAPAAEEPPATSVVPDNRDLLGDFGTLNGRTHIWQAAFSAIRDKPILLLRGTTYDNLMRVVLPYTTMAYDHLHNAFLEVLVSTGIPGFVFLVLALAIILFKGVRLFLSNDADISLAQRFLPVMLICIVIIGMVESQFFLTFQRQFDPVIFMIAGYIVCLSPSKKTGRSPRRAKPGKHSATNLSQESIL